MAKNSSIEWTHHTFNPWWGCVKVSPACKNCYAETWAKRIGLNLWGGRSERRFFSDAHWREPIKWNREALASGERKRVFCASMADVFEVRSELNHWRQRLWDLIQDTPNLDWLLLTKRPQNFEKYLPDSMSRHNLWLGVTAENQRWLNERLPYLLKAPAAVRFLSCEPLLGPLDLIPWLRTGIIDWIIAGGESGGRARPTDPRWIRSLRDQCIKHGIAFHFKQWGHWAPHPAKAGKRAKMIVVSGDEELRLWRMSKKDAGRVLDGREWNEVPKS